MSVIMKVKRSQHTVCGVFTTPMLYPAGNALVNNPVTATITKRKVIPTFFFCISLLHFHNAIKGRKTFINSSYFITLV